MTLQPQYNLLGRDIEHEIVPACLDAGIGLLPWSPLGGGWLAGKYKRDTLPTGATRLGEDPNRGMEAYAPRNAQEKTWAIIDDGREDRQAHGGSHGAGLARLAGGAAGGDLGHPRRPQARSAQGQSRRRRR